MDRPEQALVPLLLLAFAGVAAPVTVGSGVEFHFPEANTSVGSGQQYTFSSITVYNDSVELGGGNISLVYTGNDRVNLTLWNYTRAEVINVPAVKIGANATDNETLYFTFTGMVQDRSYRLKRDDETFLTVSTGLSGEISWNRSQWAQPYNFTATLIETLQNITLTFTGEFSHPDDTVTIDGNENPSEGVYTDVGLGYGAFSYSSMVAGVVPSGSFIQLVYTVTGSAYRFEQTQEFQGNAFLLPFTEGTSSVIEDRRSYLTGGLFGPGNLLSYPSPSFAYGLSDTKTVRVSLSYDNIVLQGFDGILSPGSYRVVITNEGLENGEVVVDISTQ
ncbi:MAG: hypothetical protein ABEJ62_01960 [Candidatus Nanohaloarchaea archaeon]